MTDGSDQDTLPCGKPCHPSVELARINDGVGSAAHALNDIAQFLTTVEPGNPAFSHLFGEDSESMSRIFAQMTTAIEAMCKAFRGLKEGFAAKDLFFAAEWKLSDAHIKAKSNDSIDDVGLDQNHATPAVKSKTQHNDGQRSSSAYHEAQDQFANYINSDFHSREGKGHVRSRTAMERSRKGFRVAYRTSQHEVVQHTNGFTLKTFPNFAMNFISRDWWNQTWRRSRLSLLAQQLA